MAKSTIIGSSKKKRGRPALYEGSNGKGAPQIGLRLPPDDLAAVDAWIAKRKEPDLSRPEAIRRLVELGLKAPKKVRPDQTMKDSDGRVILLAGGLKAKGK
jgi:hypothetical protein